MQRRQFLVSSATGVLAAGLATGLATAEKPTPEIVDTHTHFYDPTRPEGVPWPGKGDKRLYRRVLPEEYKRLARPFGVVGTIVVEASPWVEDNQWLLDLAAKEPFLLGIVGRLDTQADDFAKQFRRFARNPLFRGLRIGQDELTKGLEGNLIERCKLLIDHDRTLDVNGGPSMPAEVARLANRLPKLRIVINHGANLRIDGGEPPRPWREGMKAAASHPQVFCKVSALVEQTARKPAPRDVEYYRPVLDHLWACFGEDRLLFGSNWPVSDNGGPFATVVGIVQDYVRTKGEKAATRVLLQNSQAAYGWKKR
ncbi:MAG: amidohydrolase family protein [Gemmataceae bacterium]